MVRRVQSCVQLRREGLLFRQGAIINRHSFVDRNGRDAIRLTYEEMRVRPFFLRRLTNTIHVSGRCATSWKPSEKAVQGVREKNAATLDQRNKSLENRLKVSEHDARF